MGGKRSKQYRKLMQQYGLNFGFREPYQVLLDAEILLEAARCRMNFIKMLERTLHGQVKPMVTQCSMRHLYNTKNDIVINHAQNFERRRCNHHTLDEPLSTLECFTSVVDSKGHRSNKHRYVVASQNQQVQEYMQAIPGVPLVYILRSVMIMRPMSDVTIQSRAREEASKFEHGLRGGRKLLASHASQRPKSIGIEKHEEEAGATKGQDDQTPKKKRRKGPAAPNPLASRPPSEAKQAERARSGQQSSGSTRRKRNRGQGGTADVLPNANETTRQLMGSPG